jgi:hypothetical protein
MVSINLRLLRARSVCLSECACMNTFILSVVLKQCIVQCIALRCMQSAVSSTNVHLQRHCATSPCTRRHWHVAQARRLEQSANQQPTKQPTHIICLNCSIHHQSINHPNVHRRHWHVAQTRRPERRLLDPVRAPPGPLHCPRHRNEQGVTSVTRRSTNQQYMSNLTNLTINYHNFPHFLFVITLVATA